MTTPKPKTEAAPPRHQIGSHEGRIAIIAGSGRLPVELCQALHDAGANPFVVRIAGEADAHPIYAQCDGMELQLEGLGTLLTHLAREGATRLVLAGGISRRPRLRDIRWTWPLMRVAMRLVPAMARGDDRLLRTAIAFVEEHGISVMGAHEVVPDLLCDHGVLTRTGPQRDDRRDIEAAMQAASRLGALDIGQAAVAIGGRVVALEDIDGTDALLGRVAALRGHGRLARARRGVLAKCAKPGQELRADLPAIGPQTVEGAKSAGLAGIVLQADHALILDQEATLAAADAAGLFIMGMRLEEFDG